METSKSDPQKARLKRMGKKRKRERERGREGRQKKGGANRTNPSEV
jgi:hypothetical protein